MHDGRVNDAILLYLYVGLADVGLAGIGSDHTDCRLSTGDIWGVDEEKPAACMRRNGAHRLDTMLCS